MKERPLVSVIIATYNRSDILISRSVASVLNQTYKNLELIVVMDDCTDDTKKKLRAISDKRLKTYELNKGYQYPTGRQGWYVAGVPPMNKGLDLASGDLIAHLDDDDEFLHNHIEIAVKMHTTTGCDFSYSLTEDIHEDTLEPLGICGASPSAPRMIVPHCTWVYDAKYKHEKYSDEGKMAADKELWTRLYNKGLKFEFIDLVTARHYTNQKSPPPPKWYGREEG